MIWTHKVCSIGVIPPCVCQNKPTHALILHHFSVLTVLTQTMEVFQYRRKGATVQLPRKNPNVFHFRGPTLDSLQTLSWKAARAANAAAKLIVLQASRKI
jgi:hypothetical protein